MAIDPDVTVELTRIDQQLAALSAQGSARDQRINELAGSIAGLGTTLSALGRQHDELAARVAALESDPEPEPEPEPTGYFRPSILANIRTSTAERIAAIAKAKSRSYANVNRQPSPVDIVRWAGAGNQQYVTQNGLAAAQQGGEQGVHNATCALTNALIWLATDDPAARDCAIRILDGWAEVNVGIAFDQPRRTDNNSQVWDRGILYAGWAGCMFARAGAALVAGGAEWPNVDKVRAWLRDVHGPLVRGGWTQSANWIMTSAQACIEIGQFAGDASLVAEGVKVLDERIDQCIYVTADGDAPPKQASWWSDPPRAEWGLKPDAGFVDGQNQEMGADLSHAMMGLGAAVIAVDCAGLWSTHGDRIAAALETFAGFLNAHMDGQSPPPGWPCTQFLENGDAWQHSWDIGYRQLVTVEGRSLPQLSRYAERVRPDGAAMHLSYSSLTHA